MKKGLLALLLASATTMGFAQNEHMEAWKNVGVGVEAGLMGFGAQVQVPVVTDHLVLVAGYNFYGINSIKQDFHFGSGELNNSISKMFMDHKKDIDKHNLEHPNDMLLEKDVLLPSEGFDLETTMKLNGNFKVLLEYYPSANHTFHITAGLMFGKDKLVEASGTADEALQKIYDRALHAQDVLKAEGKIDQRDDFVRERLNYNLDKTTYGIKDDLRVDIGIKINQVKPYVGFGFGRAIPNKRVGFQFEMGAWFHGKPEIESPNKLEKYNEDATGTDGVADIMDKIQVFPQMTFRLTGRIL